MGNLPMVGLRLAEQGQPLAELPILRLALQADDTSTFSPPQVARECAGNPRGTESLPVLVSRHPIPKEGMHAPAQSARRDLPQDADDN